MSGWQRYWVRSKIGAIERDKRTNIACSRPGPVVVAVSAVVVVVVVVVKVLVELAVLAVPFLLGLPLFVPLLSLVTGGNCIGSPTKTIFVHLLDVIGNKDWGSIIWEHSSKNKISKGKAFDAVIHFLVVTLAHVIPTTLAWIALTPLCSYFLTSCAILLGDPTRTKSWKSCFNKEDNKPSTATFVEAAIIIRTFAGGYFLIVSCFLNLL